MGDPTSRTATPTPRTSPPPWSRWPPARRPPGGSGTCPVAETRTTRQIIDHIYRLAGHRPGSRRRRDHAALLGLVKPAMREYLHTLYQFTDRWVVDDSKFRAAFGVAATPLDDALAATLELVPRPAAVPPPPPTKEHIS